MSNIVEKINSELKEAYKSRIAAANQAQSLKIISSDIIVRSFAASLPAKISANRCRLFSVVLFITAILSEILIVSFLNPTSLICIVRSEWDSSRILHKSFVTTGMYTGREIQHQQ